MLIIFFDIKEFILADQTVNSAHYCDVLRRLHENVHSLRPDIWTPNNWLLYHDNAPSHISFFTREYFLPKQHDCRPSSTPIFSVSLIEDKLKSRHFDTIEVIETESQAVLNTHTEHDFQDAVKKWQERWERCVRAEGDYFEGGGGTSP
jgi:hypothetical protein